MAGTFLARGLDLPGLDLPGLYLPRLVPTSQIQLGLDCTFRGLDLLKQIRGSRLPPTEADPSLLGPASRLRSAGLAWTYLADPRLAAST